ncbi:uncharacterized protein KD926_010357 [Aspergillus affinis]|uniref:uncharacterized protein n=1 Tax=Aspergillus affinis TaxID=1070780 RepID=UPI0022FEC49E|nr:uncharacterized protein KD926_010357 [Aspergillus affinis]KAI9045034.1 hypothetical protein KD926_010357 [Aspergillus affinis]
MSDKSQNQQAEDQQHEASQPKEELTPYEVMLASAPPDYLTNIPQEDTRALPLGIPNLLLFLRPADHAINAPKNPRPGRRAGAPKSLARRLRAGQMGRLSSVDRRRARTDRLRIGVSGQ